MDAQELSARYRQAELLYVMKEYDDALEILDELAAFAPSSKTLLKARAQCLTAMGYHEEARRVRELLEINISGASAFTVVMQGQAQTR